MITRRQAATDRGEERLAARPAKWYTRRQTWIQYVDGLVGLWFIIFPYVYALNAVRNLTWTAIVGGLIVVVLSGWLAFSVIPREVRA